jgi:hypothetical protein
MNNDGHWPFNPPDNKLPEEPPPPSHPLDFIDIAIHAFCWALIGLIIFMVWRQFAK